MSSRCFYPLRAETVRDLAAIFDQFLKTAWSPLIEGGITADNLSNGLLSASLGSSPGGGASGGASLAPVKGADGSKRVLQIPILHRDTPGTIRQKMSGNEPAGIEVLLNTRKGLDGRLCFIDWHDGGKRQILSVALSGDNGQIIANEGDLLLDSAGNVVVNGTILDINRKIGFAGIKFSNGSINRVLNTASYTLDSLADNLYTLCYDLATNGYVSGWTISGSSDPTLDCSSFTANQLAKLVAYLAGDVVLGGSFVPSDYTISNRQHVFYLDCNSYTLNQLSRVVAALVNFLGA